MKKQLLTLIMGLATSSLFAQAPTTGLIASYSFNGGNANDETGHNNGAVNGATLTADRFGNDNMAYEFDGVNDLIDLGDVPAFQMGTNNFSISFWMHYDVDQLSYIIGKRIPNGNYDQYGVIIGSDLLLSAFASDQVTPFFRTNSENRMMELGSLKDKWHNIVISHDYSTETTVYVDGVYTTNSTTPFDGNLNITGASLVIGYLNIANGGYYIGKVDDIYIYNRTLTTTEITALFNDSDPTTVGVTNTVSSASVSTYPNPTQGIVNLGSTTTYTLLNSSGDIVKEGNADQFDIADLPNGLYLLNTTSGATKIVKQ